MAEMNAARTHSEALTVYVLMDSVATKLAENVKVSLMEL